MESSKLERNDINIDVDKFENLNNTWMNESKERASSNDIKHRIKQQQLLKEIKNLSVA